MIWSPARDSGPDFFISKQIELIECKIPAKAVSLTCEPRWGHILENTGVKMISRRKGILSINLLVICLVLVMGGCSMSSSNYVAKSDSYGDRVARKAGRGVTNIFSAPLEIPNQSVDMASDSNKPQEQVAGYFGGLFKGIAFSVGRVVSGAYDIVTCPFSGPSTPTMDPEFISSDFATKVEAKDNSFKDVTGDNFGQ